MGKASNCRLGDTPPKWPKPLSVNLRVSEPSISQVEIDYVVSALEQSWISHVGPYNSNLEDALTELIGTETLVVANGSVALMLALRAIGIGQGDEVIVPSLTYAATASSVVNVGAKPVFADVELNSWQIDLDSVTRVLSPSVKAIIIPHVYGVASTRILELRNLVDSLGIYLIEDVAEALGGEIHGRKLGNFSHVSTFSFFANKLISTGEGGAVASPSKELIRKMRILRGQGMSEDRLYWFEEPGYNFRMSGLQAALGLAQMHRFSSLLSARNRVEAEYSELLSGYIRPPEIASKGVRAPWIFSGMIEGNIVCTFCLADHLAKHEIESRPVFFPLNYQPAFSSFRADKTANAETISNFGISLPTSVKLSLADVKFVSDTVIELINYRREAKINCQ